MNLKRLRELQESLEVYGELDEAEGSYGQTPKAHAAFNDLRVKRENTPSKKFSRKSGGKTASVDRALRHTTSSGGYHPDPGKKSPRPDDYTIRQGMTQRDRDYARQEREFERAGLDMYDEPNPKGPKGSLPRSAKKRQRQKMTGVSAESFNIYDILISHLLDEGYADELKNAYCILENMSEEWVLEILDEAKWIQKAIKHPGAFSKKAEQHDMSTQEFAGYVSSHPEKFGTRTERQANLARTLKKISK